MIISGFYFKVQSMCNILRFGFKSKDQLGIDSRKVSMWGGEDHGIALHGPWHRAGAGKVAPKSTSTLLPVFVVGG